MAGKPQYTRSELKKILCRLAQRIRKSPSTKDLCKYHLPKQSTFKSYFPESSTWNDILIECGLSPLSNKYSDHWSFNDIVAWLVRFRKGNKRLPQRRDSTPGGPTSAAIKRHFGSWNNALEEVFGSANRRRFSSAECVKYLRNLGRYHTVDELKILAREYGNPHPDTIRKQTGLSAPQLQENLGLGRKYGIFGRLPVYWEQFCEELCEALYGKIRRQHRLQGKNHRRLDIYVRKRDLAVEAMTSSYETAFKKSALTDYLRQVSRLQCWCINKGTELRVERLRYLYPIDLEKLIKRSKIRKWKKEYFIRKLNLFIERPDDFLEKLGLATRDKLIKDLIEVGAKLNRTPRQQDMKPEQGRASYQVYARTFGTWRKGLEAAGFTQNSTKWSREEVNNAIKQFMIRERREPKSSDLNRRNLMPTYQTVRRYFGSLGEAIQFARSTNSTMKSRTRRYR